MSGVIPDFLLRPTSFESLLPSEDQLQDIASQAAQHEGPFLPGFLGDGALDFGRRYLSNACAWTQFDYAAVANQIGIPAGDVGIATDFFDVAAETLGGSLDSFQPGVQVPQLIGQFAQLADTLGAFESVPIVGWVISIGLAAWNFGSSAWIQKHTKVLEALPFDYSKAADEGAQRDILNASAQHSQTEIFMPYVDGSGGVKIYNVELMTGPLGGQTKVARKVAVPQGRSVGMGVTPGIPQIPRGWEFNTNDNVETRSTAGGVMWSAYRPGFTQTGTLAWNGVLAPTRRRYFVSSRDLSSAWNDFYGNLEALAFGKDLGPTTRKRIRWWLSLHLLGEQYSIVADIPAKYYTTGVPEGISDSLMLPKLGGDPTTRLTMRGVVQYLIDRQLRARQVNGLGTLLCAYTSERDAAFDGDSGLTQLLRERREQLLAHPARYTVEPERVPDSDFRSAIADATRTAGGGMKQAPPEPTKPALMKLPKLPPLPGGGGGEEPTLPGVPVAPRRRSSVSPVVVAGGAGLGLWLLTKVIK